MIIRSLQLFLILPFLLLSSMNVNSQPEVVWKKKADYIVINELDGAVNNDHPHSISVSTIARILSHVQVKNSPYRPDDSFWDTQKDAPVRVFTDREIDLLGNKLSEALIQLKPSEVVVFSVSDLRSSYLGRKRLSISGSVFIKDKRLNLLLGAMHVDLLGKYQRSTGITGTYGRLKNDLSNGEIARSNTHGWDLVTFEGAKKVDNRLDWLSIDLNRTYEYVVIKKKGQSLDTKYLSEQQQELSSVSLEARIIELEQAKKTDSSIEERLRKLKTLYDGGVLPEAAYLEKVRVIMSEL